MIGLFLFLSSTVINSHRLDGKTLKGITPKQKKVPHLAFIELASVYSYTGSLINELFVLSTAHCTLEILRHGGESLRKASVLLGVTDSRDLLQSILIKKVAYPEEDREDQQISKNKDIGLILVGYYLSSEHIRHLRVVSKTSREILHQAFYCTQDVLCLLDAFKTKDD